MQKGWAKGDKTEKSQGLFLQGTAGLLFHSSIHRCGPPSEFLDFAQGWARAWCLMSHLLCWHHMHWGNAHSPQVTLLACVWDGPHCHLAASVQNLLNQVVGTVWSPCSASWISEGRFHVPNQGSWYKFIGRKTPGDHSIKYYRCSLWMEEEYLQDSISLYPAHHPAPQARMLKRF